jgi:hypothetical protein
VTEAVFAFSETLRDFSEHKHRFRHEGLAHTQAMGGDNALTISLLILLIEKTWQCPAQGVEPEPSAKKFQTMKSKIILCLALVLSGDTHCRAGRDNDISFSYERSAN